jgi:hypothetical protein
MIALFVSFHVHVFICYHNKILFEFLFSSFHVCVFNFHVLILDLDLSLILLLFFGVFMYFGIFFVLVTFVHVQKKPNYYTFYVMIFSFNNFSFYTNHVCGCGWQIINTICWMWYTLIKAQLEVLNVSTRPLLWLLMIVTTFNTNC